MTSIRNRLLLALIVLVAIVSAVSAAATYRRVLDETTTLFDYELRQTALSLRGQISLAPRIELPAAREDEDFVVQIWDVFGARTYSSRPGLPVSNQIVLGYADLSLRGETWRAFGLQTADGVIQVAQPARVRQHLARAAALRVVVPVIVLLPVLILCVAWVVQRSLSPLRFVTREVQQRDAGTLTPLGEANLPEEIAPLVGELNRLLGRLSHAFSAQRDFIADAAHELRSPLTSLRLQLQLLERAADGEAKAEARHMLSLGVERAIHLVEQLLTLARSDPHVALAGLVSIDLTACVREAVADCHTLAEDRHIDLGLDAPAPLSVPGDKEALRVLARNLIDNAVRYTPSGGSVQVACRTTQLGAVLEVIDSGPGIPRAERERIFDRFYRLPQGQELGTGLGLAIVKAIVERHRATISLGEAPGGGLAVHVSFPKNS
jgi:two-component system OmpR family sensor kinase/two-component system sensor histidine kinase QseC